MRSRSSAVASRWQGRHSVRMFSRSHSPPPSATGRMWSASHRDRRAVTERKPHISNSSRRAVPRERLSARYAARVSVSHIAQTPRSRARTWSRRYPGSERRRHSCTQKLEQNVLRRGARISSRHHRQSGLPFGPSSTKPRDQPASASVRPGCVRGAIPAEYQRTTAPAEAEAVGFEVRCGYWMLTVKVVVCVVLDEPTVPVAVTVAV